MLIIDKTNQVSVFAVSNSQTDTAAYATNTVYEMLLGNDFIKEKIVLDYTDTIASLITFIGVIVLIIIIILTIRHKKCLTKKITSRNNGKKILGLTLLIVFLILLIALPYIVGYNYLLAYIWLPFSAISALAIWIIDILFMIIVSIFRLYKMHLIAKPQE
jgi:small-conductance mechanosensitive channel